ncbi:MAG: hypothetical protein KJO82_04695 [Gammaproteobacteria bacterium]|nr:hypothetical protein [Gammaproteobacteria bacterium]
MMKLQLKNWIFWSAMLIALIVAGPAGAQKATERYIPIGKSPGASYEYSYIGKIIAVDADSHAITVRDDSADRQIHVTPDTRIWLDRSSHGGENSSGTFEDCEVGRTIEVMHLRDDSRTAAWIKVQA